LRGVGTIQANVQVSASVAAGFSPGTITVNGNLVLSSSSSLQMEIDSDSSCDKIVVSGSVTRAGSLIVKLAYTPVINTQYTAISHASATGSFATITSTSGNFTEVDSASTTIVQYSGQAATTSSSSTATASTSAAAASTSTTAASTSTTAASTGASTTSKAPVTNAAGAVVVNSMYAMIAVAICAAMTIAL